MIFRILKLINSQLRSLTRRIHKGIDPIGHARKIGVKMWDRCRLNSVDFGEESFLISIGNHVSVTKAPLLHMMVGFRSIEMKCLTLICLNLLRSETMYLLDTEP